MLKEVPKRVFRNTRKNLKLKKHSPAEDDGEEDEKEEGTGALTHRSASSPASSFSAEDAMEALLSESSFVSSDGHTDAEGAAASAISAVGVGVGVGSKGFAFSSGRGHVGPPPPAPMFLERSTSEIMSKGLEKDVFSDDKFSKLSDIMSNSISSIAINDGGAKKKSLYGTLCVMFAAPLVEKE